MTKITWKQFKETVETKGVNDNTEIDSIVINECSDRQEIHVKFYSTAVTVWS